MPIYVSAYLGAIVAANLLVAQFGPSVVVLNAFLFIGLDLTCRDKLHDAWEGRELVGKMGALIFAGGALSYILNAAAGPIAVASCVAFALAAIADGLVYAAMGLRETVQGSLGLGHTITRRRFSRLERVNGSNVVGAAVDSLIFPTLAFGALFPAVILGQFVAKVAGGFVWSVILAVPQWRRAA